LSSDELPQGDARVSGSGGDPNGVNIERLVAEFGGNAEAIATIIDVE
jgi:hypothetical protein